MNETDKEALALAQELVDLIQSEAQHQPHLHETEAAKIDTGGALFCGGCRRIVLSKRLAELESVKDDVQPQSQFRGKSRLDVVVKELLSRREIEAEAPRR